MSDPHYKFFLQFLLLQLTNYNTTISMVDSCPPLLQHYGTLPHDLTQSSTTPHYGCLNENSMEQCELPLIDLTGLNSEDNGERMACAAAITGASSEWGFFQVMNHGISPKLLRFMRNEQVKLFETSFEKKVSSGILNNSYRWGSPAATMASEYSWSEAYHIPLTKKSEDTCYGEFKTLREVMEEFAAAMSKLARQLSGVLAENLGHKMDVFDEACHESTSFLRLNRYPPCPISPQTFGLVPHTDSDFLTLLYQDQVGGLQLKKDSKWVDVKPNQDALIVNIGDLFQAWSNDMYKSVEHKVMANKNMERYSIAYFLCPSYESLIGSCKEPSIYRNFTFGEYRSQVQRDVKNTGHKVGLPRFIL